jgi:cob(I)alamin adenosyltransferase
LTEETAATGLERGLFSIFTGPGKGKTSAAVGTAVRAAGHGLKVYMLFFLKGDAYEHGEFKVLKTLPGVTLKAVGERSWVHQQPVADEYRKIARQALAEIKQAMKDGAVDVVVIDEANLAITKGLIDLDDITTLVEHKPDNVELIITGRNAEPALVRMADLVSEILMIKHPFAEGVTARRGIDY